MQSVAVPIEVGVLGSGNDWLRALRRYIAAITVANLAWEFAQLPLYSLWNTATRSEMVVAAVHCTGGDVLIATASIMLALILFGTPEWPAVRRRSVIACTVLAGLSYTLFSEWLNIVVRQSWAYSDLMPVIPGVTAGLSPILQWIFIPLSCSWWALRPAGSLQKRVGGSV